MYLNNKSHLQYNQWKAIVKVLFNTKHLLSLYGATVKSMTSNRIVIGSTRRQFVIRYKYHTLYLLD